METYSADSDDVLGEHHLDLIVDGTNAVNSKVMRSTIPQNMIVPLDNTTASCSRKCRGIGWPMRLAGTKLPRNNGSE